jgi:hypothetical protein
MVNPFALTIPGRGGRGSSGEIRPPIIDGRRPGCDDERLRPGTVPIVVMPGNEEDADLGCGTDPADATESAGEVERELGGPDVFVLR